MAEAGKESNSSPTISSSEAASTAPNKKPLEVEMHEKLSDKWRGIWQRIKGKAPETQEEERDMEEMVQNEIDQTFDTGDFVRQKQIETEKLSFKDPLTGLPNRGAFDKAMVRAVERVHRINRISPGKASLTAIMIDLDHFKLANDKFGHPGGDEVLKAVSKVLAEAFGRTGTDFVGRFGGEEFIALVENRFGNENEDEHQKKIEYLQEVIKKITEEVKLKFPDLKQTASIGLAQMEFNEKGDPIFSPEELVKRADKAVYKAKAVGRNTVVAYDSSLESINTEK